MSSPNLRHAARAIILDEDDRVLLCRFMFTPVVWAPPGGGIESGESPLAALRRELLEEVGLTIGADPPHVWRQRVESPEYAAGYDGVMNDFFLVRTESFDPRGTLSDDELAAENMDGLRWWRPQDIAAYRGPDLFSPRDLATPLAALIAHGVPARVVRLGP
ncbi:NUDIX hydrolase [Actinoallomurus acaciae]|uniref:NUDIX hydrolase n=1 Tax=Actinoallomurus acaciae TaxID=502577 RepID=A0ABV5YB65_9ACTN